jgi:hypothetical protein
LWGGVGGGREQTLRRVRDLGRFGHAARPELGLGHRALVRADEMDAVSPEGRDVPLRRRMLPHAHVHGRREEDGQRGGEQDRGGEVVGQSGRHLGHEVRGRGRDHDQVGIARKLDVADIGLVLAVEQVRMRPLPRQRGDGEGRHEMLRPAVITGRTLAPRSRRRRTRSSDL